jgi:carbon storage regulator CsrA
VVRHTDCYQKAVAKRTFHGGKAMLVLTRRTGEEIVIGGSVRVKVLAVEGDRIRLGITAPDSVTVNRQEVHERQLEFVAYLGNIASTAVKNGGSAANKPLEESTKAGPTERGKPFTGGNTPGSSKERPEGRHAARSTLNRLHRRFHRGRTSRLSGLVADARKPG